MDGVRRPSLEIPLKLKYRAAKPKGHNRANYMGNSGRSRHKHQLMPMVPGIKRKRFRNSI